ncbi:MAG: hypothetical protein J6A44_01740 [Paludibacteraceae bacterium]|nr:hypothetical protein [Paludibacteraceae bacterium]
MNNLFSFDNLITDGAIWLALTTINMTIIGLTSLAETKRVIGVNDLSNLGLYCKKQKILNKI